MIHSLKGIPHTRFLLRDYYIAIACEMCHVSPLDVVTSSVRDKNAVTARSAVLYALYLDGGISSSTAGAMMGIAKSTACTTIERVSRQLLNPKRYALLAKVVDALNNSKRL